MSGVGNANKHHQAWVSGCRCCNERRHRRSNNARRTSLAIVNHKARIRLGSTVCSSSGRNHLRLPTMWVNNLASNASNGGLRGCRRGRLRQGRLRTKTWESTICISGGRNHRRLPTMWGDNLASNTSVSGSGKGGGRYRVQWYIGLAIAMRMTRSGLECTMCDPSGRIHRRAPKRWVGSLACGTGQRRCKWHRGGLCGGY
jgi:hypothetical protein